jgi:hypothetical protein
VPDTNIFKTDRLNTAVYLHASKLLPYVGIRRVNHFKVEFVFEDADHKAAEIEMNFESGASLPVTSVLASLRFLRYAMTVTMLVGKPSAAKSVLALSLGNAIGNGLNIRGHQHTPRPVLYLDRDDNLMVMSLIEWTGPS